MLVSGLCKIENTHIVFFRAGTIIRTLIMTANNLNCKPTQNRHKYFVRQTLTKFSDHDSQPNPAGFGLCLLHLSHLRREHLFAWARKNKTAYAVIFAGPLRFELRTSRLECDVLPLKL